MEPLILEGTVDTPAVKLDGTQGLIELKGKSSPENSVFYFKPIMEWLDGYVKTPAAITNVNIQLEYFNTSSSKCILNILRKLEVIHKEQKVVLINWYYEKGDVDMLEAAKDYESMIKAPFNLIEIENMSQLF
jgi:hypothetical protein